MSTLSLKEASAALDLAQQRKLESASALEMARRLDTDNTNKLNAAQRAFDEAVALIHKGAARDSDWFSAHVRRPLRGAA